MPGAFIQDDMAALLNEAEFAVRAAYGGGIVSGIFDNGDVEVTSGEGVAKIVRECSFTGRSVDFPNIAEGETVTIGSASYTIRSWIDDGTGEIEIIMEPQR